MSQRVVALAERDPRRAALLARRALAGHPGDCAQWRYALGWALLCWERFDQAREHLRAALALFESQHDHLGLLRCRYGLLLADIMQAGRAEMLAELDRLAMAFAQLGAHDLAIHTRLYQAVLLNIIGRPRDADDLLARIAPEVAAQAGPNYGRWLRIQAAAAGGQSDYLRATALLEQAEQAFLALGLPIDVAKCWYEQAWIAVRQERFDTALACYQRVDRIFGRLDLPLRRARCQKECGYVLALVGAYDMAIAQTSAALRYFTTIEATREIAGCRLHLGNIYFQTSRWDVAITCYERAEALFAETGILGDRLIARRNRAMALSAIGQRAEAQALLDHARHEALALGNAAEVADITQIQASLLADAGEIDGALTLYRQAHTHHHALGNLAAAASCSLDESWLLLRRGHIDAALAGFEHAAPILHEQPHHRWRADYGLARCAEAQGNLHGALAHYGSASATIAALRQRLMSEDISSSMYRQSAQFHAAALRLAGRVGDSAAMLALTEHQRALVLYRMLTRQHTPLPGSHQAEYEALRQQITALLADRRLPEQQHMAGLARALADYNDLLLHTRHSIVIDSGARDLAAAAGLDLDQVRAQLQRRYPAGWTALVYVLVDQQLWIIGVTPDRLIVETCPYDPALRRLIDRASQPIYRSYTYRDLPYMQGQTSQRWSVLQVLADQLLPATIQARLHPDHRLIILPCGRLHVLPWAALRLGDRWLAELAIVQLAPSLSSLQVLATRAAPGPAALLVGCSAFGGRAPGLAGVASELAAVASSLDGLHTAVRDEHATRAALLDRSQRGELATYGLLHIASHAQMLSARGLVAHIKLWDDDLWLTEIADLQLGGGLVTLSTCDGAAAEVLPGEEILSLSWAFLAAGAGGVVASLWPVYDRAATALMQQFYLALRRSGDAAQALAVAQRAMITAPVLENGAVIEVSCWSSFVMVGIGALLQ
jgi:CHAT domain-containing protein